MNLLRDEKFKDLLNFRRTFEEKVLELSGVVHRFRNGQEVSGAVRLSYEFLNSLRIYLNARRDLGSRKIALDHLARLGENGDRAGDARFQDALRGFREAYHGVEDEFVAANNMLTESIHGMLEVLGSGRMDDAPVAPRDEFVRALDDLLEGENGRYPRFSDDPVDTSRSGEELEHLRRRIESLDEELSAVKDQRAALQDAVQVAIEKERDLDTVREEAARLRAEVEELRQGGGRVSQEELRALQDRAEDVQRLEEELRRVTAEREALRAEVESDSRRRTHADPDARHAVEKLDARVQALETEIGALRSERDALMEIAERAAGLQEEIVVLRGEREQLLDRLTTSENAAFAGTPARRSEDGAAAADVSDELSALEVMTGVEKASGEPPDFSRELSDLEDMTGAGADDGDVSGNVSAELSALEDMAGLL